MWIRRSFGLLVLVCLVALPHAATRAQQRPVATTRGAAPAPAAAPKHIRILSAGGLLGQYDGMPEYPGGPYDTEVGPGLHPYGGLQGLIDWVQNDTGQKDLFLMTANNLPREVSSPDAAEVINFFRQVGKLNPSAIALGVEDFLRGLDGKRGLHPSEPPGSDGHHGPSRVRAEQFSGGLLSTQMRESPLPFIVSNAAVRLSERGLNQTEDHGFALTVDPDRSVAWVRDLSFSFPCRSRKALSVDAVLAISRVDAAPDRLTGTHTIRLSDKACTGSARLSSWLRPGTQYGIQIVAGGKALSSFRIRTDERFTNRTVIDPGRPELPLILSLVDPHVRDILAREKFTWRDNGGDSKCSAAACEILILPPAETIDQVLAFEDTATPDRPLLLLSQLEDRDTSALLQRNQRIRFVVLPPDSGLLGRAAPRVGGSRGGGASATSGPFSGDLGYGAILNAGVPSVTQIWSRPEWFGEAIHVIDADVAPGEPAGISNAVHEVYSVKGRALCARQSDDGKGVTYLLKAWHLDGTRTVFEETPPTVAASAPYRYVPVSPESTFDPKGRFKQGDLWTSLDTFAAVALDAMRREFNTDLAVLPANAIDENWFTYLRDDPHAPREWLSRVLLERLLFRAGTIVKVRMSANEVYRRLGSAYDSARSGGAAVCVSGFGMTGCGTRAPSEATLLNERRLDENRYYTIALPESAALENRLTRFGDEEEDLVDVMNQVFAKGDGTAPDSCSTVVTAAAGGAPQGAKSRERTLAQQLEHARASENSPYFYVKPAEFSFNGTQIHEPPGGEGLFNKLPIPSNGAKPSQRGAINLGIDIGMYDTRNWAARAIGKIAYGSAILNGQSASDPNAWLAAFRVDRKMGARGRYYGGLFWESQFSDQVTNVTPTSKGITGPTLPLITQRRDYRYLNGGFELLRPQVNRWFSLDPLGASAQIGVSYHEHVDIAINGDRQGLAALQKLGVNGVLNAYFATHLTLPGNSVYAFVDEPLMRARVQVDITPRFKIPFPNKAVDVSLATTYRRFIGPNMTPLTEHQSAVMRLTVGIPLYGVATLNLNAATALSQVVGIDGWYRVWQPSVSVSIPVISSRHGGWIY